VISSQPNSWQSRLLLAAEYHRSKRVAEAKTLYLQVLEEQPNQPDALHLLGALAGEAGDFQQAVDLIQRAIIHGPNISNFHNDLGVYFHRWKKLEQAEASFLEAIRLDAKNVDAQFNLGLVLRKLGRFRETMEAFSRAILLKPDFADAHRRLGAAYMDLGQIDLALTHLRRAVHVQHDYVDGHMSLGVLMLLLGNFTEGWPEYEWRLRKDSAVPGPQYTHPTWQGQDLGGRTILLRAEQGIGDTIHFVRYAPLVAARGGKVILACQRELKRLLARLPYVDKTVGQHDFIDGFDVQCPLPSRTHLGGQSQF
jgi:tetratricopeptide (TPR) repeat protein